MYIDKEVWKDIPGYEGYYQVSDHGRVKSLERVVIRKDGKKLSVKEKVLKGNKNSNGYLLVALCLKGETQTQSIHTLVAQNFLDYTKGTYKQVVDHIDHDKTNNHFRNLRLVTNRENVSHRKKKGTSLYTGVSWSKQNKKWKADIKIKGKREHLGYFDCEQKAANAYQKALENDTH